MAGRGKRVASIALAVIGIVVFAVVIRWLEVRRSLRLLEAQGASFVVAESGSVLWMTLPPEQTTDDSLWLLHDMPELVHLTLADCPITDAGLQNLGTLENLKKLDLSGTHRLVYGPNDGSAFVALTELRLACCPWVDDATVDCVNQFPKLTVLDLSGTEITDASVEILLQLDQLSFLSLADCPHITDAGARRLLELPHLTQLNLQGASISIACWNELSTVPSAVDVYCPVGSLPAFQPLRAAGGVWSTRHVAALGPMNSALDPSDHDALAGGPLAVPAGVAGMACTVVGPIDPRALAPLGEIESLVYLSIRDCPVDDEDLQWLNRLRALESLDLSGTNVSDRSLAAVASGPLVDVSLAGTRVTDTGLAQLAGVSTLKTLSLSRTAIRGEGFEGFSELRSLAAVDLTDTSVTDRGAECLAALPALSELRISGSSITDAGLRALGEAPCLQYLEVDAVSIHAEGLAGLSRATTIGHLSLTSEELNEESLCQLQDMKSLRSLSLDAPLGDRGVQHLAGIVELKQLLIPGSRLTPAAASTLGSMPELRHLSLSGRLSDDFLTSLLAGIPSLESLSLHNASYNADVATRLIAARPDLNIWK